MQISGPKKKGFQRKLDVFRHNLTNWSEWSKFWWIKFWEIMLGKALKSFELAQFVKLIYDSITEEIDFAMIDYLAWIFNKRALAWNICLKLREKKTNDTYDISILVPYILFS